MAGIWPPFLPSTRFGINLVSSAPSAVTHRSTTNCLRTSEAAFSSPNRPFTRRRQRPIHTQRADAQRSEHLSRLKKFTYYSNKFKDTSRWPRSSRSRMVHPIHHPQMWTADPMAHGGSFRNNVSSMQHRCAFCPQRHSPFFAAANRPI